MIEGWLNIYKPRGISSAKAVSFVKRVFRGNKIGHTGTLDVEAEGVLPIAIGKATKLTSILMDAKKKYVFTVKFGTQTDSGDASGKIIATTNNIPTKGACIAVCDKFIGEIKQVPPAYSALKVNGQRAYKLARSGKEVKLPFRKIIIYDLKCLEYDSKKGVATYETECSKGTYIRTLAEDIALCLQSLGFVLELRRTKVGMFVENDSINITDYLQMDYSSDEFANVVKLIKGKCLKVEDILDDIPVLEATDLEARKIRYGQKCFFACEGNLDLVWIRNSGKIVAIGSIQGKSFKSSRVFN
ncbi:MAG: tRNA pseudouridine(55) synthase TruB [Rickettsiaceae bacterium]|nr:tRNA pseudouridine(55) synthase TruB [Rickettsiaceae bacterium]